MKISRERLLLASLVTVFMVLSWSCSNSSEDQSIPIKIQTPTTQTQKTTTTQAPEPELSLATPDATLKAWMINEDGETAAVIKDESSIPINIQSAELTEIDGELFVKIGTSGIPNYVSVIDEKTQTFLSERPLASRDFRGGRPLVGVGSRVQFGEDIGYNSTGCQNLLGTGYGYWPPGPVCPENQEIETTFAIYPTETTENNSEAQGLGSIGLWVNGVAVFGWSDGQSWQQEGNWHNIAAIAEEYDLDICPGHSAQGTYHHHSHPICLAEQLEDIGASHSPVYGFAIDGVPIAGPWVDSGLLARSSWLPRDYSTADSITGCGEIGKRTCHLIDQLNPNAGTVEIDASAPSTSDVVTSLSGNNFVALSGFYMEDWYYESSLNDNSLQSLDEHNGHFGELPGYTDPLYHYHVTRERNDDGSFFEVFPYYIGPTFYGEIKTVLGNGPPGAGRQGPPPGVEQQGPPPGGGRPDLPAVAQALGVDVTDLMNALGPPPPDLHSAATALNVSLEELQILMGPPG
ncbi:MAG: YHYH protein [Acidimicrobiales bacterium]|nr:YHYH protein [Acidimicrobiales bacterium]